MISDDSLNEADDSFFDLYSTKKVTNTYNAVLEKLKSASSRNEGGVHEQNDVVPEKVRDEVEIEMPFNEDSSGIIVLDDSPSPASNSGESTGVRRSARLSKKEKSANLAVERVMEVQTRNKRNRWNKRKKRDSDPEIIELDNSRECNDVNTSLDDEFNYEVSVKVIWKSVSVQTFRLRRFQKFSKIFEHFMKEENIPIDKILLSLKTTKIGPNDTPESVNLKVYDFIEGGVLSDSVSIASKSKTQTKTANEKNSIVVKVQDVAKNIFKFSIDKNESLKSVMIRYAEQIETPLDKIKFYFDGELLSASETPTSLGLDNDEIIDVKLIQ